MHIMKAKINGKLLSYVLCVMLLPLVVMLYQYQRNIEYLSLSHVLVFCIIFAAVLVALFFILRVLLKTDFGAFIFVFIFFVWFFSYRFVLLLVTAPWRRTDAAIIAVVIFIAAFIVLGLRIWYLCKKPRDKPPSKLILTVALAVMIIFLGASVVLRVDTETSAAVIFIVAFVMLALLIRYIGEKFRGKLESKLIPTVALAVIGVLIMQNIVVIAVFAARQQTSDIFYKDTFYVTEPLEKQPNIYWFHVDGMLGFDGVSRFFGDDQEEFAYELESRGFWINREAAFDGRSDTQWALPTLMSPFFYDRVISWVLDPQYAQYNPKNEDLRSEPSLMIEPNTAALRTARERNELVAAFTQAGFNTSTIANFDMYFYPTANQFYEISGSGEEEVLFTSTQPLVETLEFVNSVTTLQNFFDLLHQISPLPGSRHRGRINIPNWFSDIKRDWLTVASVEQGIDLFYDSGICEDGRDWLGEYNSRINSLYDILAGEHPSPKFTIIEFGFWHIHWVFDEYGNYNPEDARNNPTRYLGHHIFGTKLLLQVVDLVLQYDPEAVIILQADHGLHRVTQRLRVEGVMELFSCTEEEAVALWHSVMSAVRFPEEQMTPETERILSDPRNISRFLINNFVGQNYEYIPYQFRQVFRGPESPTFFD